MKPMPDKSNQDLIIPTMPIGRPSQETKAQYMTEMEEFADKMLNDFQRRIPRKVSARGWCYILEGFKVIDKSQFDYCEKAINNCRKEGLLPIDFVLLDVSRKFFNVEPIKADNEDPKDYIKKYLRWMKHCYDYKDDVAYWENQQYYIQMMVEKIDVREMFLDTCEKYHIPINNAKGWSDILSRAELIGRFKEAEEIGLKPVLLYYGDFDPAGLLIGDSLKKNLRDLKKATKWNPKNLIVDHFGLSIDFINKHNLTWIDNLMTSGGKVINKNKQYVKDYIKQYGENKVEANAVLFYDNEANANLEKVILGYLGADPLKNFDDAKQKTQEIVKYFMEKLKIGEQIDSWFEELKTMELKR